MHHYAPCALKRHIASVDPITASVFLLCFIKYIQSRFKVMYIVHCTLYQCVNVPKVLILHLPTHMQKDNSKKGFR